MAVILIIDDESAVAGRMSRTLQRGGHLPLIAPDARSATRGAALQPAAILLDLELSSTPVAMLLRSFQNTGELMRIPVLVTTGRNEEAVGLRRAGRSDFRFVLLKPVADAALCLAVWSVVSPRNRMTWPKGLAEMPEDRRLAFLRRLVEEGPEWLALQVYRRVCPDRVRFFALPDGTEPLGWHEILDWARLLDLMDGS